MGKTYTVEKDYQNTRFDKWFKAKIINLPQSLIEKLARKKKVKINKKKVKTSYRVQFNDIVELYATDDLKSNNKSKKENPILGIHVIGGATMNLRSRNSMQCIKEKRTLPFEIVCKK